MKILFLAPYPYDRAPSQRFRFEQYFDLLRVKETEVDFQSFVSTSGWNELYKPGNYLRKAVVIAKGFVRRVGAVVRALNADYVFIHRELTPIGPPLFEWFIARILRKKIIYDFDDAIWLTDNKNESAIERIFRWRGKVGSICKWAYKVSCGNYFLRDYARRFNPNSYYNPTTIDTHYHYASNKPEKSTIVIGWTGSHTTLKYLDDIVPALRSIEQKYPKVSFTVIANKKPDLPLTRLNFVEWKKETEIEELNRIDIGLMPLPDDDWSKGKCAFKILQYMATEIPTCASPVGANNDVIVDEQSGLFCSNTEEWIRNISRLIEDPGLCRNIAEGGSARLSQGYTVESNVSNFFSLFE